jgi:ribosomal protein S27E
MQADPMLEWRRLSEHYREMSDGELYELVDDFGNLTDTAQQVLHSEMKSRGLGETQAPQGAPPSNVPPAPANVRIEPERIPDNPAIPLGYLGRMPQIVPDAPDVDADDEGPHEYTWKTVLCDCDTNEQAKELSAALRQAGLDSWIQQSIEFGRRDARVLVAADQLEQARAIAANPIPQETADESKEEVPEFVEPKCPKCGSDDVVLEGVDPENQWRCEHCDAQWTESAGSEDEEAPKAG